MTRGYSEAEAKTKAIEFRNTQKIDGGFSTKCWTKKGYSEAEAKTKIQESRKTSVLYWTKKGYSEAEAKTKQIEFQKEQSRKGNLNHYDGRMPTQKKYWLNRGYSSAEAKRKVSKRQSTTGIAKCIVDHGIKEGISIYSRHHNNSVTVVLSTMETEGIGADDFIAKYKDKMAEFNRRKYQASKSSIRLFLPVYLYLKSIGKNIKMGYSDTKEMSLSKEKSEKSYRYDFSFDNIIVEFSTEFTHGRYKENKKYLYGSVEKSIETDLRKKELAVSLGYAFINMYDCDYDNIATMRQSLMRFIEQNSDVVFDMSQFTPKTLNYKER